MVSSLLLIVIVVVPIFLAKTVPSVTVATSSSLLVQIGSSMAVFSGSEIVDNVVVDNGTEVLYGEAYSIKNGEQRQICTDDKWIQL